LRCGSVAAAQHAAQEATLDDLLEADGIVLATPENFGYMAGKMKDFFDRTFYPAQELTAGLPYLMLVSAGTDGQGAIQSMRRIATGYGWKEVLPPVLACGESRRACGGGGAAGGIPGCRHADWPLVGAVSTLSPKGVGLPVNGRFCPKGKMQKGDAPLAAAIAPECTACLHAVGVGAAGNQVFQCICLDQLDVLVVHAQPALLLEFRQGTADGFQFEAQEAADFFTAHAQDEVIGSKATGGQAL
jgi:multimeric flavodoxin WrbA